MSKRAEQTKSSERECAHCKCTRKIHARDLCKKCYRVLEIRFMYSTHLKRNRSEIPDSYGERPLPSEPTQYLPGTEEKIRVMAERAIRGEQLFHPDDAKLPRSRKKIRIHKVHLDMDMT